MVPYSHKNAHRRLQDWYLELYNEVAVAIDSRYVMYCGLRPVGSATATATIIFERAWF
jgi:hypothetical protein